MDEIIKYMTGTIEFISGGTIGGILGFLLKTQIDHRLAIARIQETSRISEFNKAVSEFRAAFAPAIFKFKITSDLNSIDKLLKDELINQGIAIEKFRPFVNDKKAFQEAWENYHLSHKRDGVSSVYFLDYAMGDEKERFALFNQRINDILKFAE
jgi:hypothetical protein